MTRQEFEQQVKEKSPPDEFRKWKFLLKYIPPNNYYYWLFLSYAKQGDSLPKAVYEIMSYYVKTGFYVSFTPKMDNDAYNNPKQVQKDFSRLKRLQKKGFKE